MRKSIVKFIYTWRNVDHLFPCYWNPILQMATLGMVKGCGSWSKIDANLFVFCSISLNSIMPWHQIIVSTESLNYFKIVIKLLPKLIYCSCVNQYNEWFWMQTRIRLVLLISWVGYPPFICMMHWIKTKKV